MTRRDKLLGRLRATKAEWSHETLTKLLEYHGFKWRDKKHRFFYHTIHTDLTITIPRNKNLRKAYPQRVERMIGIIESREAEMREEEQ